MSLDYHDVDIAVRNSLIADGTLTGLIGTSPNERIYTKVPMSHLLFPFVRMTQTPNDFETASMGATEVTRIWSVDYQFNCYSQLQTNNEVAAVLKAVCDVMEDESNLDSDFTTLSMGLRGTHPKTRFTDYDSQRSTWVGVAEFRLTIQEL